MIFSALEPFGFSSSRDRHILKLCGPLIEPVGISMPAGRQATGAMSNGLDTDYSAENAAVL
jgi:hypothetical protein